MALACLDRAAALDPAAATTRTNRQIIRQALSSS